MFLYKRTQIGYFMACITVVVLAVCIWIQRTARAEAPSYDSGSNMLVNAIMVFIVFLLASFSTLTVRIEEQTLKIRFGWGIVRKQLPLTEIATIRTVRNPWYYGWGVHYWFPAKLWIYTVSGFDAIELTMKNGSIYRIGTDEPEKLETALHQAMLNSDMK